MDNISIQSTNNIGKNFIPKEYLPKGKDEYYLRNKQTFWPNDHWRQLKSAEINQLIENGNWADDWKIKLVGSSFDPSPIKNNKFYGLVRIGQISAKVNEYQDLKLPVGITNSLIVSCDIGDNVAIHNVAYLAYYIIGDQCVLFNVNEMLTTNTAKFGNGIMKQGEAEGSLVGIDVMNEAGGRSILPFDGITTADAYLWAKYQDDKKLQKNLKNITQNQFDDHRGYYGIVSHQSVIKNSRKIKDIKAGECCQIQGINKLQNLTINSSQDEPSIIGEGVELVDGIIGHGCNILSGSKAVRFILGNNSNLKFGARVFDTFLGDNSTISCCEVLNNLIFPAHEQHHNNSFLIATLVMGQSNIAAGATIGSNHNSRANDNEIEAGRGFWPGLCTSVKHYCRFASFVLLAKGNYPAELDIPLPFSLLNNNVTKDQLEVMPAYWWLYNMYALVRNTWKFKNRDIRKKISQHIEFDFLAPDTVEEIVKARRLLEIWTAKAHLRNQSKMDDKNDENILVKIGKELLSGKEEIFNKLEVLGESMEKSRRKVIIIKTYQAYHAYTEMLHYYAVKNLMNYLTMNEKVKLKSINESLKNVRKSKWINFGGQLISEHDLNKLRVDIIEGKLKNWDEIHNQYDELWKRYPMEKQKHAYAVLCYILGTDTIDSDQWKTALDKAVIIQEFICDQAYITRKKDYDGHFNQITFRNTEEMAAVNGIIEDNSFIQQIRVETDLFIQHSSKLRNRY